MSLAHISHAASLLKQAASDFSELRNRVCQQLRFEDHLQARSSDSAVTRSPCSPRPRLARAQQRLGGE